jgi:uncharacterized protein YraI
MKMSFRNITKAAVLGGAVLALSAGAAFAAVATSSVNVRTGPSTSYRVIDTLRPGERVDVTGRSGGWCEVAKSGPNGWVSCAYLADAASRYYRDDGPNFSLSFGVRPDRPYRPHRPPMHWNNGGWWYGSPGSSFGLSFSN